MCSEDASREDKFLALVSAKAEVRSPSQRLHAALWTEASRAYDREAAIPGYRLSHPPGFAVASRSASHHG